MLMIAARIARITGSHVMIPNNKDLKEYKITFAIFKVESSEGNGSFTTGADNRVASSEMVYEWFSSNCSKVCRSALSSSMAIFFLCRNAFTTGMICAGSKSISLISAMEKPNLRRTAISCNCCMSDLEKSYDFLPK